jgi:hypothetical protein
MAAQVIQGRGGCERVVALCVRLLRTRLCRHPATRLRPRGFDSRTAPRALLGTLRLDGAHETAGFISGAGSALSLSLSLSLSLPLPPSLPLSRSRAQLFLGVVAPQCAPPTLLDAGIPPSQSVPGRSGAAASSASL